MANATSLIAKVDKILTKFNPLVGTAYKRITTPSGGDSVTGRGSTTVTVDTAFSVPPLISEALSPTRIGRRPGFDTIVGVGSTVNPIVDLIMTVSPSAISETELQNPAPSIVIKNGSYEEEYFIVDYDPSMIYGANVLFDLVIRSKKRG